MTISTTDAAVLAQFSYNDEKVKQAGGYLNYLNTKISDKAADGTSIWQPVKLTDLGLTNLDSDNPDNPFFKDSTGYAGAVLKNSETGEIIVVHRGTEGFSDLKDLGADSLLWTKFNLQKPSADVLYAATQNYIQENNLPSNVLHIGDSLGGNLATITAGIFDKVITFDPAGSGHMQGIKCFNIKNYIHPNDWIASSLPQVGEVYFLDVTSPQNNIPLTGITPYHNINNFIDNTAPYKESAESTSLYTILTPLRTAIKSQSMENGQYSFNLFEFGFNLADGIFAVKQPNVDELYIGTKTELEAKIKELNNNTDYDLYYGNNSKLSYHVPSLGESFGTVTVFADDLSDLSKAQPLLTISDFLNSKITYQQLDNTSGQYLILNPEYDPSTINNTLLDFRSEITPTSNDATKNDMAWATEGAAIHGGDYKTVTDMNTINGNGFQNEQMMKAA